MSSPSFATSSTDGALPIDNQAGFPQSFSTVFEGTIYHFTLYVNLPLSALAEGADFFELPGDDVHLVARVEVEAGDGERRTLFLRKVVPGLVYETGEITLEFPRQKIARDNLNGRGEAGSEVVGRIGRRWA